jgi:hypothetical protein
MRNPPRCRSGRRQRSWPRASKSPFTFTLCAALPRERGPATKDFSLARLLTLCFSRIKTAKVRRPAGGASVSAPSQPITRNRTRHLNPLHVVEERIPLGCREAQDPRRARAAGS